MQCVENLRKPFSLIVPAQYCLLVARSMNHLDYEGTEEDLTVTINSEDGSIVREVTVNSALLRMLSPWWKSKLASSGFKDEVINGRCTIHCESPTVSLL